MKDYVGARNIFVKVINSGSTRYFLTNIVSLLQVILATTYYGGEEEHFMKSSVFVNVIIMTQGRWCG